jgi:hypothetical protein
MTDPKKREQFSLITSDETNETLQPKTDASCISLAPTSFDECDVIRLQEEMEAEEESRDCGSNDQNKSDASMICRISKGLLLCMIAVGLCVLVGIERVSHFWFQNFISIKYI